MSKTELDSVQRFIQSRESRLLANSPHCAGCERGTLPLSLSPVITYNRAKAIDLDIDAVFKHSDNLTLLCAKCLTRWDGAPYEEKRKLKDFKRRTEFLAVHDMDRYIIFVALERQYLRVHAEKTNPTWLTGHSTGKSTAPDKPRRASH